MIERLAKTCRIATLLIAVLTALATASKSQLMFTEYPGPSTPTFQTGSTMAIITTGPDGNLWFTEGYAFGSPTQIGRITPYGVTTYFPVPSGDSEGQIAAGPGGLWFTEYRTGKIGMVTIEGVFTEFTIPNASRLYGIALGSDGALWFTDVNSKFIGRITSDGVVTEFPVPSSGVLGPVNITSGPDGNLWVAEPYNNLIRRITTGGVITEFPVPAPPWSITGGPDGNVWFTEPGAGKIGKITPSGVITEFLIGSGGVPPEEITTGPDGNLWFTESNGSYIGRITLDGVITEFAIPSSEQCRGITTGPDGNLWFLEARANKIVKAVLTPAYSINPLYDQTRAVKRGACYPVKIQVFDANGANVSSAAIAVNAVSVTLASTSAPGLLESVGNASPDNDFRYDSSLGGYIFNLDTAGLGTGTWNLNFTAGVDPTIHTVQFQVK